MFLKFFGDQTCPSTNASQTFPPHIGRIHLINRKTPPLAFLLSSWRHSLTEISLKDVSSNEKVDREKYAGHLSDSREGPFLGRFWKPIIYYINLQRIWKSHDARWNYKIRPGNALARATNNNRSSWLWKGIVECR